MGKMKLHLEDLQVESFSTAVLGIYEGTVRAHQDQFLDVFGTVDTCPPVNTCNQTNCGGYSCEWTKCVAATCKAEALEDFTGIVI